MHTITVTMSVFASGMSRDDVMRTAQGLLEQLLDGTDFVGVTVVDAVDYDADNNEPKVKSHNHQWNDAGKCDAEECNERTYSCACGAYKTCDGEIIE